MRKPGKQPLPQGEIKIGFNSETVDLRLDQIVCLKMVNPAARDSSKYKQILTSIQELGIIEPLVVAPEGNSPKRYILLDGHLRLEVLKELEKQEVTCLVSNDDESFTYNKHINRLSAIQEHRMIARAVERGVPEAKIAKALNLDVSNIVRKRNLLEGICSEAADLLKDKFTAGGIFPILRRMKSFRQIEAASLMNDAGVYSASYARALLAATPKDQLANPEKPKKIKGLDEKQMARMESEMANLHREYQLIEENYGTDVLNLTLAKGYSSTLLSNSKVARYLAQHHAEMLSQFQKIVDMASLSDKQAVA